MDAFTTARTSETTTPLHVKRIAAIPELPASAFFIDTDGRPIQGATNTELAFAVAQQRRSHQVCNLQYSERPNGPATAQDYLAKL